MDADTRDFLLACGKSPEWIMREFGKGQPTLESSTFRPTEGNAVDHDQLEQFDSDACASEMYDRVSRGESVVVSPAMVRQLGCTAGIEHLVKAFKAIAPDPSRIHIVRFPR